jgi:bifunctional non-homologous end joining protein LigD
MKGARAQIAGKAVELSNLKKVMYPATGFTKAQVIDYYTRAAALILPHLKDRPITLKRYPDGVNSQHFYEKNAPSFTPPWIKTFSIWRTSGESQIRYILINDLASLVWSANIANLELHPLLGRVPRIDAPTMVVFDLDPGDGADILKSCEVALLLKKPLDRLHLKSFVKTSGSKGIHVHIPLNTPVGYASTQPFAKAMAQLLESEHPNLVVSEMAKAKRQKKVSIDWSQNAEHKSTVAVYSLCATGEEPFVAMPVSWRDIKNALHRGDPSLLSFTPATALGRMQKTEDLFRPVLTLKQRLPAPFLALGRISPAPRPPDRALEAYRKKRDFSNTPEPAPSPTSDTPPNDERLFVIQKHAASRLHYDLRLQMQGVLKSWAVPKGPPWRAGEKRLAMQTEDHPLEYARFEGTIPKREYGGGTVMVWDIGSYEVMDGNYEHGKLHLFLRGTKLNGEWVLVRKDDAREHEQRSWLLIKAGRDATAPSAKKLDLSALTSRAMEQIAEANGPVWHSDRRVGAASPTATGDTALPEIAALPRARARFIEPMLARSVSELPPDAKDWGYEIKFDGYRCIAVKEGTKVTLCSRNKNILNDRFGAIAAALGELEGSAVIDGEIVALDEQGRPSFHALRNVSAGYPTVVYFAFDLPLYRDRSLLAVPLQKRRELLKSLISRLPETIRFSETFESDVGQLIKSAEELSLEGVVAKRRDGLYEPGERSGSWLKHHIKRHQEFVIGGYTPGNHGFDSLLVGIYERGELLFVGKVRNGFVPDTRRQLFAALRELATGVCPFANLPEANNARRGEALTPAVMKKCKWLKPRLVARIEFTEWTDANHLRHARFAGLRNDKDAAAVVRESR